MPISVKKMLSSPTSEIKERLNIVEVVGSYVKLEKAGQNFKAKCPFHNEKTPSFFVSPKRNSYYCFGCGAKGDIFNFVEQFETVDFVGALRLLAEKAGVKLRYEPKESRDARERLFATMEAATTFFERNLVENPSALKYLTGRGLLPSTIKNWRLGFALDEWHLLEQKLTQEKFSQKELLDCGLIKQGESNKIYDTFRCRLMFPIFDSVGRVVAFSGRIFGNDEGVAKYLNSPETELFKKSETLYGYHIAKNGIRRLGFSILVEGQMDLLMSQQAGFDNTVATSGTALTVGQLSLLKRISPNIIIAFDNDSAGVKASQKAFAMALAMEFNVKAVKMADDKDPADQIAKNPQIWKEAIKNARHIVSYQWEHLLEQKLPKDKFLIRFKSLVMPMLRAVSSDGERLRLINEHQMSLATGIREEHLLEEIKKMPLSDESVASVLPTEIKVLSPVSNGARRLFGILFALEDETLSGASPQSLRKSLEKILEDNFSIIFENLKKERDKLLFETELAYGKIIDEKEIAELLINVEEENLRERLLEKMRELQKAELENSDAKVKNLLTECQEITKRLAAIKDRSQ